MTFTVKLDNPFPAGVTTVSNQAIVRRSNFSDQPSDDPRTSPAGDPTVNVVTVAGVPIPTLSEWAAMILALLLAAAAARRLRTGGHSARSA